MTYEDMCITTWKTLAGTYGDEGAAAVMGNLRAESAINPKNLQNSHEAKLGYNDDTYTAAVDAGTYTREQFSRDKAGYGLAQWTYWSRKQNLYDFTRERGYGIGELTGQLKFLIWEIGVYKLDDKLRSNLTMKEKTALILRQYEKPADTSDAAVERRFKFAQQYYDKYHQTEEDHQADDEMLDLAKDLVALSQEIRQIAGKIIDHLTK